MMKLFLFIQILIGFILFIQISDNLLKERFISIKGIFNFGIFFIFLNLLFIAFFRFSVLFFLFSCYGPYLSLFSFEFLVKYWQKKEFEEEFTLFLNEVILYMRSGQSFRNGIESSKKRKKESFRKRMDQIMKAIVFSKDFIFDSKDLFIKKVFHEFRKVDLHSHNALKRLIYFRNKLQFESHFKRKSKKILAHIRLQSFFLCVLYFFLLIFTFWKYGFKSNSQIIFISMGLFFIGFVLFVHIGRNLKWKV